MEIYEIKNDPLLCKLAGWFDVNFQFFLLFSFQDSKYQTLVYETKQLDESVIMLKIIISNIQKESNWN